MRNIAQPLLKKQNSAQKVLSAIGKGLIRTFKQDQIYIIPQTNNASSQTKVCKILAIIYPMRCGMRLNMRINQIIGLPRQKRLRRLKIKQSTDESFFNRRIIKEYK